MNATSCDSRRAGSRTERALALALVAVLAAACSRPAPLTAADLQLPLARAPGFTAIEPRFAITDRGDAQGAAPDKALEQMRRARVTSATEVLYRVAPPGSGAIKVRIELFVDEPAAQANWKTRHRPEALAMTTALDAGDAAWVYRDQMAGLRVGRAIFEFRGRGGAAGVADFARAHAEHAKRALARAPPG